MSSPAPAPPLPDGVHPSSIGNTVIPLIYDASLVSPAAIPNRGGIIVPKRTTVEFFYDVVSPYSWLAFEVWNRYKYRWNIDLQLRPMFLGAVMQASGNRPPATIPTKGKHMARDVKRLAKIFNVPLQQPKDFATVMMGTLNIQRLFIAVQLNLPDKLEAVSRAFWLRVWSRDQDIASVESQTAALIAAGIAPSVATSLIESVKTDARIKSELKTNTDRAIATGAFGAPWSILRLPHGEEAVWGSDRFEVIAHMLGVKWLGPDPDSVGIAAAGNATLRSRL